jgi:hypothetical protein
MAGLIYKIRVSNLPSKREAEMLANALKGKAEIAEPIVSPQYSGKFKQKRPALQAVFVFWARHAAGAAL